MFAFDEIYLITPSLIEMEMETYLKICISLVSEGECVAFSAFDAYRICDNFAIVFYFFMPQRKEKEAYLYVDNTHLRRLSSFTLIVCIIFAVKWR